MNILLHSIYYPPEVGGLETHVGTLAKEMVRLGHSVHVVTSRSGNFPKNEIMDGVSVERKYCPNKKITGWGITTFAGIRPIARKANWADICHAHCFPSIIPCEFAHRKGVPFVATIHTSHFLRLARKPLWRDFLRYLISKPELILAPSKEIRDVCLELQPRKRVYALVNSADTERFQPVEPAIKKPQEDAIILVVPRRLFEKNGVIFAVKALPLIRQKYNAHIYLIGDGPEREKILSTISELNIAEFVHLIGAQPNELMPGFLSSADIVLIPSLIEATSVAGLESMACERPIVASDVGGLPEIISEETGRLVPSGNPPAIAESVINLLSMPRERLLEMGKIARKKVVDNWSVSALAKTVLAHYDEAKEICKYERKK